MVAGSENLVQIDSTIPIINFSLLRYLNEISETGINAILVTHLVSCERYTPDDISKNIKPTLNKMDITVEKLNHSQVNKFIELIRLFEDVFEMTNFNMPDEIYLQHLLAKNDFFVFVALSDNKVIGGLTSYIMQQYYSKFPLVYIFDLAVQTARQRQGIGKTLIRGNNTYCKTIGAEAVMVQADEADDYAIEFYRSTGATAENVIHFEYLMGDRAI